MWRLATGYTYIASGIGQGLGESGKHKTQTHSDDFDEVFSARPMCRKMRIIPYAWFVSSAGKGLLYADRIFYGELKRVECVLNRIGFCVRLLLVTSLYNKHERSTLTMLSKLINIMFPKCI